MKLLLSLIKHTIKTSLFLKEELLTTLASHHVGLGSVSAHSMWNLCRDKVALVRSDCHCVNTVYSSFIDLPSTVCSTSNSQHH